jgi:toxin-antitoxin system PIN domain toxin
LVDVNLWLALLVRQHEHHRLALKWFDGLAARQAGLCRVVQLAIIRLLANRSILGEHAISLRAGWDLIATLLEDERVEFAAEPPDIDAVFPTLLHYPIPTGKLIADAYLAAFSICDSRRLVTLDRGLRQFQGLDLDLLNG